MAMMMMISFFGMVDPRKAVSLFPAKTIVRGSYYHKP